MALNASKILPGLYQGGAPDSANQVLGAGFELLVLCACEVQPPKHALGRLRYLRCPLDDTNELSPKELSRVWETAHQVVRSLHKRRAVLVTCAQGYNRSGLVTGVAVHLLTGWDGARVVEHIQRRRRDALFNPLFAQTIRALPARQSESHVG